ncbi:hypothetical protein BMR1_01G03275 [Babesia microti strain RI]|uniref:Uncharacterized protein n=1 Tax=Babesia microti (strain RI) TaxID=1133968 RepID=I7IFV6_BABMR|nr:hypothetical protein BMR1_01G03275 [Babesia microti strain RI]CCF73111.1 hypothetical protein BMR1_01G03275 [Babesia microti strain RI]|eukprot:XP_012647720.1 hypothetical protein BMR1_01G03275 [Babesia microti strain RI]
MPKSNLWKPLLITLSSFLYGLFLITLGLIELFNRKISPLFTVTTLWFGFLSILAAAGAQIGLFSKDYLTITSSVVLITLENLFIFITSIISLFDVIYNYRFYMRHRAHYVFVALEKYRWFGILVFAIISFLSLSCILYMWTFYETMEDEDVATLLGHPFNMTSDFWHYPTARSAVSKLFTPRKPMRQSSCNFPTTHSVDRVDNISSPLEAV